MWTRTPGSRGGYDGQGKACQDTYFGSLGGVSCCTQVQLRLRSLSDVLHGGVEGPDRARQHRQAKPNATQNFAMVDQSLEDQLHRTEGAEER